MKTLLVNACIGQDTQSLKLAEHLLNTIGDEYDEVCLEEKALEALNTQSLNERDELIAEEQFGDERFALARQFADADRIVIATPYWDFSYPALLKVYLENVLVEGITYKKLKDGNVRGLCRAQELYYVTTSDTYITEDDHGFLYIEDIAVNFFGILRTVCFAAEKLGDDPEKNDKIIAKARKHIDRYVARHESYIGRDIGTEFPLKIRLSSLINEMAEINRTVIYNFKPVLAYIIIYTIAARILTKTILDFSVFVSRKLNGMFYVGNDNFTRFVLSPKSWIVWIITGIILTYLIMFEISGLIYTHIRSRVGVRVSLREMISASILGGRRLFVSVKNIPLVIFTLAIFPALGLFSASSMGLSFDIPEFITDYISANPVTALLFLVVYVALGITAFYCILVLPAFVASNKSFMDNFGMSIKLMKGRFRYSAFCFIGTNLCYSFLGFCAACVIALVFATSTLIMGGNNDGFTTQLLYFISLFSSLISFLVMPVITTSLLLNLYCSYKARDYGASEVTEVKPGRKAFISQERISKYVVALVIITLITLYYNRESLYLYGDDSVDRPLVAAHRGDSVRCPENSMSAFEKAIEEKADWVELDVHETKDGTIIVSHDDDLKRVTGKKIYVHDHTYEELMEYDTGSWFSEDYSANRFSTLEEVLTQCKGKVKVQIEIKPTEFDNHIEEKVIDIIRKCDMVDETMIISLDADTLKVVKKLDPDITTAYCMSIALGDIQDIDFADHFSVEAQNANEKLVNRVHKAGKKIFVWTINDPSNVQRIIYCEVDGILSDDPVMLRETIDNADYSGGLRRIFAFLQGGSN